MFQILIVLPTFHHLLVFAEVKNEISLFSKALGFFPSPLLLTVVSRTKERLLIEADVNSLVLFYCFQISCLEAKFALLYFILHVVSGGLKQQNASSCSHYVRTPPNFQWYIPNTSMWRCAGPSL